MAEKLKILLVNDFERGGGAEGVFQMTANLLSSQYEVYQYTAYQSFENSGSNPLSYIYSRQHYNNIRDIIVQNEINIVHIHNFRWISPSVLYVHKWLKKHYPSKVKFLLTAHDYLLACPNVAYGYYGPNNQFVRYPADIPPRSFLWKQMDQHGIKFSVLKKLQWYLAFRILNLQKEIDIVIAPSVFLQKVLQLNYPNMPVEVIRNPLSPKILDASQEARNIGKTHEPGKVRLIYFGRVASEKGTDVLIEMLSEIKENIDFSLDIFGTGPLCEEISPLIMYYHLNDKVHYHGFKAFDELRKTFSQYDAFIMSSIWYENAPLSIVEAAVNRLAVITPNMGGMKELAALCGSDFQYELGNAESLRQTLNTIATSFTVTSEKDLEKIRKGFSPESYIQSLSDCYNC